MRCAWTIALIAVCLSTASGCATTYAELMPQVHHDPLPLDPTEQYEIAPWWASESHLLRLDPDAGYALYEGRNRYRTPIERGRWDRLTYAAIRLDPYSRLPQADRRVSVDKIDGEIVLLPPGLGTMHAIKTPPPAPEDDLFGRWIGDATTLTLDDTLEYALSPNAGWSSLPAEARPLGHVGTWRLDGDRIVLTPRSSLVEPITLAVERDNDAVVLQSNIGAFHR